MPTPTISLNRRPAWKALRARYNQIHGRHLKAMLAGDHRRGERLVVEAAGLYFDYSKHRVIDETLRLLLALAEDVGLLSFLCLIQPELRSTSFRMRA